MVTLIDKLPLCLHTKNQDVHFSNFLLMHVVVTLLLLQEKWKDASGEEDERGKERWQKLFTRQPANSSWIYHGNRLQNNLPGYKGDTQARMQG